MRVNVILILTSLCLCLGNAYAQQIPLYNSFYNMPYIQNAAYSGYDSTTTAFILYRNQWAGINNSPESAFIGVVGKLPNDNFGVGLTIQDQSFNIHNRTSAYLNGSYGLMLTNEHRMRFGMELGIIQNRIDFDEIDNADPTDPAILANSERKTVVDGNFGFLYTYKSTVEIGFSALQIMGSSTAFIDEGNQKYSSYQNLRHFFLHGKFYLPVSIHFDADLLGGFRSVQGLTTSWEVGTRLYWDNKLWALLLYRDKIGSILGMGMNITSSLEINYMFEFPINSIDILNSFGTHEIAIQYRFNQ